MTVESQERAAATLGRFLESGRIPSAMLFTGPDGVGKTMMAREFAQALLCVGQRPTDAWSCGACPSCAAVAKGLHPDVKLVNAAYQAGVLELDCAKQRTIRVGTVRHLRRDMELQPMLGSWKAAIIPEAALLETEAANALLKALEEPPPRSLWILTTSRPERVLGTVLSRCLRVPFAPLAEGLLRRILARAGLAASQAEALAALCDGSASRALALAQAGWPFAAAEPGESGEALPREAAQARTRVETIIFCLEQDLRRRAFSPEGPDSRLMESLRELGRLRAALESNCDPATVLLLARRQAETP